MRAAARRKGYPPPIFSEVHVKPLQGGGFQVDIGEPGRPLRESWGGTEADVKRFQVESQPFTTDTPALRAAVAKMKAQYGIVVEGEEEPPTQRNTTPAPKRPKHKASAA